MSATDPAIHLACFLKAEFPDGDVRLCDGGFLTYDSESYTAADAVFGAIQQPDALEAAFGDMAESGTLTLAPARSASVGDWWRTDLENCRIRIWMGEYDPATHAVATAELLADLLVDTITREQGAGGQDLLRLGLMGRAEKLFLIREGNVCSERFHKSVWPGEDGFNNCTDVQGFVAWGAASPPRSTGSGGSGGFAGRSIFDAIRASG